MENNSYSVLQMIPPFLVVSVLLYACLTFYRHYVIRARKLQTTLDWIRDTLITIKSGSGHTRKAGLTKVFQGTILQDNWNDFSRTLHEQFQIVNGQQEFYKLRITVPASYFFTAAAIIDKPLKVNYFKHLPGILTGIGIIGTFAGLLFGLSAFDTSSPEKINQSVTLLLHGVRDAFYASAFAITAAMVVTHVEKLFYQRCLTSLEDLNDTLNSLFEPGVSEEYLAKLSHSLTDPAEQARAAGERLVEALAPLIKAIELSQTQFTSRLASSLEQSLSESNARLASQIEASLGRQVKQPIETLGSHFGAKLRKVDVSSEQLVRKIRQAQQEGEGTANGSEAA